MRAGGVLQRVLDEHATPEEPYVWMIEYVILDGEQSHTNPDHHPKWYPSFSMREHVFENRRYFSLEEAMQQAHVDRSSRAASRRLRNLLTGDIIMGDIL